MSTLMYRLINPPVKLLLRSPLHGLLSSNTLLLEFTGRKSGRTLSTPISYYIADETVRCFTSKSYQWWQNLQGGKGVKLTIAGTTHESQAIVESRDEEKIAEALLNFLIAVPRDAAHSNVAMVDGQPDSGDIKRAAPKMVYLSFALSVADKS